jgi:hypothetical protein
MHDVMERLGNNGPTLIIYVNPTHTSKGLTRPAQSDKDFPVIPTSDEHVSMQHASLKNKELVQQVMTPS